MSKNRYKIKNKLCILWYTVLEKYVRTYILKKTVKGKMRCKTC